MKKILALAFAVMMICVCSISVFAAETKLPDSDGTGWWVNHTDGIEVTEKGVEITFTSTTYESAAANWNGPLYVLYTGDEAKVNGAGYVEYWVGRGDAFGWGNAGYYGATGTLDTDPNNAANLAAAGITFSSTGIDGWVGWDNFVAALKAGAEGKVTAKLADGKVHVVMEINGLQSTLVAPVDTTKPVYISLFAELAKLTNIVVTTPDDAAQTGDMISVVIALMAISGTALVSLKKKH